MRIIIAAAFICLSLGQASAAEVEKARRTISIPAQGLGTALQALAKTRDLQVVYRSEMVEGLRTEGVSGELTIGEALTQLLRGTGLTYEYLEDKAITIVPAANGSGRTAPAGSGDKDLAVRQAGDSPMNIAAATLTAVDPQASRGTSRVEKPVDNRNASSVDEEMVIFGERIVTRNRVDTVEPILVYEAAYFERFEPLTLNDMLKRVPGVYFDQLANFPQDGASVAFNATSSSATMPRFRNLDAKFSQILVNGRKIASIDFGFGGDTFLATIPAEAVKEVRVIRSPSAEIDSSGVGMTLDVILKDGSKYTDSSWRVGGAYVDHNMEPVGSVNVRGSGDRYTYSLSATSQNRTGVGRSLGVNQSLSTLTLPTAVTVTNSQSRTTTVSSQTDRDRNLIGNLGFNVGARGRLDVEGKLVQTYYEGDADTGGTQLSTRVRTPRVGAPTTTTTLQTLFARSESDRDSSSYGGAVTYKYESGRLRLSSVYSYDRTDFDADSRSYSPDPLTQELFVSGNATAIGQGDRQQLNNHLAWTIAPAHELRFGADLQRASDINDVTSVDDFGDGEGPQETVFAEDRQTIERQDIFAVYEWRMNDALSMQLGVRHERSRYDSAAPPILILGLIDPEDFQFDPAILSENNRSRFQAKVTGSNPSAHLRWALSPDHELRFSVAQTVRRPNLSELDPQVFVAATANDFVGSDVTVGNPQLKNEEAIGFDVGYNWRLENGVIGLNYFNRSIENLIEQTTINLERFSELRPDIASEIERLAIFASEELEQELILIAPVNSEKKTRVNGLELDMSFPLNFISPEAHFYMNATYSRRKQADTPAVESSALNLSYDHLIESLGFTYGAGVNWITRDHTHSEIVNLAITDIERKLDPNLEVFVEKKFGASLLARLTVENLTDAMDESVTDGQTFGVSTGVRHQVRLNESDPRIMFTVRGKF